MANDALTEHQLLERLTVATQVAGIFVWEFDWIASQISFDRSRIEHGGANRHYGQELDGELFKWVHPDDMNVGHRVMCEELAKGRTDASFRYRLRLADGTLRHIQAHARTTTDAAGIPVRSLGVSWDVTAEVEAAEQLRANVGYERKLLAHLSLATEAAGIECWEYDYTLERFTWFYKLDPIFGAATADPQELGRRAIASVLPEDAAAVHAATVKALADGTQIMTTRMRRRIGDGEVRHLQLYQKFARDAAGRPLRALGATRDITAEVEAAETFRAQAEALHDAQRRLERASLSTNEGHWEVDLDTGKHWASSSYYTLLGYTPEELKLDSIEDVETITHPEDLPRVQEIFTQNIAAGTAYQHDMRLRLKDGSYHWFLARAQAERDAEGRAFRLSGSMQDIHKQKLAESALIAARQRFERAIRGTQDGLWEWDLAHHSLWVSPRFEAILGFAEGEISGAVATPENLVHSGDLETCRTALAAHFDHEAPFDVEVRMRTRAAQYRWVRLRGEADRDPSDHALRLAGSLQDVSEAHAARDALIEASEAAQAASRSKSAFLANVSHEIRTPMNGILGMTSLLLDSPLDGPQREQCETIHSSATSLLTVINDILDFSKIEAGKLDIESVEMHLPETIVELRAILAFQSKAKGLELDVRLGPDVPSWVLGDRQRIRQCLVNLLSNAIKFTSHGRVSLEVSVQDRAAQDREQGRAIVRFEVRDTGIGIAPEVLPTLFQPFVQADSSTTRHFGGTGLGLSIVRRLIELMSGEVGVASELGHGSTFWFVLPLPVVATASALDRAPRPHALTQFARAYAGKVLLVEDNLVNQKVAMSFLERLGCEVTLANNGLEAIQAFVQERFELVLLDLQMPLLDGYAATSRLRKLEPLATRTPIVALTASAMAGQRERCLEAGMDDLLTKPLDIERLQSVLDRFGLRAAGGTSADGELDPAAVARLVAAGLSPPRDARDSRNGTPDAPIVLAAFLELTGGDGAFAREIAATFLATSEALMAELRQCAGNDDRAGIARAAHSLKGASANVHAYALRELCAEIEIRAAEAAARELVRQLARLEAERLRVVAALQSAATPARAATGG
ncbi:MAG: PAS domain-containing protein [Steroidobacteraceae bacterium]